MNALLIIDAQFDFCHPKGALYVQGAEMDMVRLASFIRKNQHKIHHITLTIDSHPVNHIAHPSFWEDENGNFPPPFTQITLKDVTEKRWKPRFEAQKATKYLADLEKQGLFPHFIWAEHCLKGALGASIDEKLMAAVHEWTRLGYDNNYNDYQTVRKGEYALSENFGIFQAQIPDENVPETQLNVKLLEQLATFDKIWLAGEAKSHCVATSLNQLLDYAEANMPTLIQKLVILEDCMSDVAGLAHLGAPAYIRAKALGVAFANSANEV